MIAVYKDLIDLHYKHQNFLVSVYINISMNQIVHFCCFFYLE